jgi:predicted ester cyclase
MTDEQTMDVLMNRGAGAADPVSVAIRSIHTMASGRRADFDDVLHPDSTDRENKVQPPTSRVRGPAGFYSTAMWLRAAFADLHYDIHHAVAEDDLVVVNSTMNGRHTGTFVVYREDGEIDAVFPPTGKTFAMAQTHWLRFKDGKIIEHWATRDDLGQARQLGWLPPSPSYLIRCALAKRRAIRAVRRAGR